MPVIFNTYIIKTVKLWLKLEKYTKIQTLESIEKKLWWIKFEQSGCKLMSVTIFCVMILIEYLFLLRFRDWIFRWGVGQWLTFMNQNHLHWMKALLPHREWNKMREGMVRRTFSTDKRFFEFLTVWSSKCHKTILSPQCLFN